ncbi:MAG: ABC transporter permease [Defluviitaleaceae bacterium]|nr:ABC transporter permease [Defluviitaleaceae bacterium]
MKKYIDSINSAINSVLAYKLRSTLTMLGIIIGISAVILITSIGDGVYRSIYAEMNEFNMSSIMAMARNMQPTIDIEDVSAISNLPNILGVSTVSEIHNLYFPLRGGSEAHRDTLIGLDHNYTMIENISMLYGRFFSEQDFINASYVTVITSTTSLDVFGTINSVGMNLDIEGRFGRFSPLVIGIIDFDEDSLSAFGTPFGQSFATMPATTVANRAGREGIFHQIQIILENPTLSMATSDQIARLLNLRHDTEDAFMIMSLTTVVDGIDAVLMAITAFITFVAGISLFVGGVGVMNIMMVTVTERTKEIGIKKSLGATGTLIRLQFVAESIIITVSGGIIGIIFGLLAAHFVANIITSISPLSINMVIAQGPIVISVLVSIFIGVIFGVVPAGKAANLDPVESLRYE